MPNSNFKRHEEVLRLADEIAKYLAQRESAADTFEGLITWWLFRQKLDNSEKIMREAIEHLCETNAIKKRTLSDGSVIYSSKKD